MIHALLVDDDRDLARLLTDYLGSHEVTVTHVEDGPRGLAALAGGETFDVVLLDVMLPGIDGFEVCRRIRAAHDIPVVMLTARGDDADRIVGLEIGADDYVPKPFNPRELLARVRAVLRRARPGTSSSSAEEAARPVSREIITVGPLEIDHAARVVKKDGAEVTLTSFEYRILLVLARRAGETITREELATEVREPGEAKKGEAYDPSVDRSLDVHISRLRQKLEEDPKDPRLIKTVRGVGYVLSRPA